MRVERSLGVMVATTPRHSGCCAAGSASPATRRPRGWQASAARTPPGARAVLRAAVAIFAAAALPRLASGTQAEDDAAAALLQAPVPPGVAASGYGVYEFVGFGGCRTGADGTVRLPSFQFENFPAAAPPELCAEECSRDYRCTGFEFVRRGSYTSCQLQGFPIVTSSTSATTYSASQAGCFCRSARFTSAFQSSPSCTSASSLLSSSSDEDDSSLLLLLVSAGGARRVGCFCSGAFFALPRSTDANFERLRLPEAIGFVRFGIAELKRYYCARYGFVC